MRMYVIYVRTHTYYYNINRRSYEPLILQGTANKKKLIMLRNKNKFE